jgi:outer membrane protein OmpA-like peptidoglycan-associated protein
VRPFVTKSCTLGVVLSVALAPAAAAQFGRVFKQVIGDKVADKAKEKADSALAQRMGKPDSVAAKTANRPDSSIRAQRVETSSAGTVAGPGAGGGMFLGFDFVPGTTPLFTDDFKTDKIGNFPSRLEFKEGNMEVAQWNGGRFLRLSSATGNFVVPLPQKLPAYFTLEFAFMPTPGHGQEIRFTSDKPASMPPFGVVTVECYEPVICDGGIRTASAWTKAVAPDAHTHELVQVRVLSEGAYAKVYLNGTRVANVPNANLGRSKMIVFDLAGDAKNATLVGPITVATGGNPLYETIAAKGRASTQGIYFDVGSDQLQPASGPTLKEIAAMLAEHPALKLTIEGHTDNQGDLGENQALSERRAAAVKDALVKSFGADASRLSTKGMGASKPVASNATPEGRARNRRTELIGS